MADPRSLFLVDLNYVVPLSEVDKHAAAHIAFLDAAYADGLFLVSGPKVPRTGGVIIAKTASLEELHDCLANDPFQQEGIAEYQVTEFKAAKQVPDLFD